MPSPVDHAQSDNLCIASAPSSPNVIDILSAAFQTQTSIDEPAQLTITIPRSPRSSRMLRSAPATTSRSPSLRKCSSSHTGLNRQTQEAGKGLRKRDSSGINLAGLMSAATNLRQRHIPTDTDTDALLGPYRHQNSSVPNVISSSRKNMLGAETSPTSPNAHSRGDESLYRRNHFHTSPSSPRKLPMMTNPNVAGCHRTMPSGRVGKRTSGIMINASHNPHGASSGHISNAIKAAAPIQPHELAAMLDSKTETKPLVIDMRSLPEYDKLWIDQSINVNLPTLMIKRYRRGALSNFSLQNFITSEEGKKFYLKWIKQLGVQCVDDLVLDMKHLPSHAQFVVCDEHMDENDKTSHAWTLIGVLDKCLGNMDPMPRVYWLRGGFEGFKQWDTACNYTFGQSIPDDICPDDRIPDLGLDPIFPRRSVSHQLPAPIPTMSRSATISTNPSMTVSTNTPRRASVFTLDTSGLRKGKKFVSDRNLGKEKERKNENAARNDLGSIVEGGNVDGSKPLPNPRGALCSPVEDQAGKSSETGDDDCPSSDQYYTALPYETTPATTDEYAFIISEIVPGFLYLGPEVATPTQAKQLKSKSIRRILNMAEECDDDVPGLKQTFVYTKVAARDTIEMKDVDGTLRRAVKVIDDSKKNHEPIYVHCKAGKSRSVAVILAYLVLSEHWTLKRAYRHVIKARPNASPNIGFVAELMKLEESIHGRVSNFAGTEWHLIDSTNPPSPDSQQEIGKLQKAWRKGSLIS
ncbi:hypothetical protein DFQ28_007429 [Apophysomyces sp. BC1034]|nr:hypothetical protein DFQ30_007331 [Apophysomyces sp. BC1015]KAG0176271.1 hypothetical protein DFQ29_006330 [Apophysomyces sp. BC1021]KAG0186682.1 hypothetical protein DFQ28_007429 [Apophysomyces sp. BC1034]